MSFAKITAIGHLGNDCTVRTTETGYRAITFSIACTEKFKDKSGVQKERTLWIDCTIWKKPEHTKIADYLRRGTQVYIEGRPSVRAYKAKSNDEAVGVLNVRVDEIKLLGGSAKPASQPAPQPTAATENFTPAAQGDDLPF